MFGSSLPPVAGSYVVSFISYADVLRDLTISVAWGYLIRGRNWLPLASTRVHPNRVLIGSVILNLLVFCFVLCIFALLGCVLFDFSPMDYHSWFPLVFITVSVAHMFSFCVVLCMFVCLCTVYCLCILTFKLVWC